MADLVLHANLELEAGRVRHHHDVAEGIFAWARLQPEADQTPREFSELVLRDLAGNELARARRVLEPQTAVDHATAQEVQHFRDVGRCLREDVGAGHPWVVMFEP